MKVSNESARVGVLQCSNIKTRDILDVQQQLGHRSIENTMIYTHLITFESDEYHTAYAKNLEEEDKLIKAGFELVRYSDKEEVAIYRKRK